MPRTLPSSAPMLAALLVSTLTACDEPGPTSDDVVGPFTGATHRYVVDRLDLPNNTSEAIVPAADLDGDGFPDNIVGAMIGGLRWTGLINPHAADLLASGVLSLTVELRADDLANDPTVSAWVSSGLGGEIPLGGRLVGGSFASNRTRTSDVPGAATLRLPVLADAEPSNLPAVGLELDLTADGRGGFDGVLRGGLDPDGAMAAIVVALQQAVDRNPGATHVPMPVLDTNLDGKLSDAEARAFSLMSAMVRPDVRLRDGAMVASFGFRFHLIPCASGTCVAPPPAPTCFDGVRDGDESDLDCGGSCALRCSTGRRCTAATDCDAAVCNPGAADCAAPRCDDGRRDGFERGLDCGGPYCAACPP